MASTRMTPTHYTQAIAELEELEKKATPKPWYYDSYSKVFTSAFHEAYEELSDKYIDAGEPEDKFGRPAGDWNSQLLELEPLIASVPPHHGDTAIGRQHTDAALIALSRNLLPELLEERRALLKIREESKCCPNTGDWGFPELDKALAAYDAWMRSHSENGSSQSATDTPKEREK